MNNRPVFVLLGFVALAGVSWIFRVVYRVTGGLAILVVSHVVGDIAILWVLWRIMN